MPTATFMRCQSRHLNLRCQEAAGHPGDHHFFEIYWLRLRTARHALRTEPKQYRRPDVRSLGGIPDCRKKICGKVVSSEPREMLRQLMKRRWHVFHVNGGTGRFPKQGCPVLWP
jgi:hypothetical protein